MTNQEAITYMEWMKDLSVELETQDKKDTMIKAIDKAIEYLELFKNVPENPTCGDMIKALFPDLIATKSRAEECKVMLVRFSPESYRASNFNSDWWDSSYKTFGKKYFIKAALLNNENNTKCEKYFQGFTKKGAPKWRNKSDNCETFDEDNLEKICNVLAEKEYNGFLAYGFEFIPETEEQDE